ncbi:hypothetical protein CRU92_08960 [Arcobacter sp. FW59]|nr:hypothetical protein CRU92_08960 [Arcobacter sp. FW59]
MKTLRLEIDDKVFDKVIFFLNNFSKKDILIIEEETLKQKLDLNISESDTKAFSNHTANLIEDWQDLKEDEIWK